MQWPISSNVKCGCRLRAKEWAERQWQWHVKRVLLQVLGTNAPIGLLPTPLQVAHTIGQFGRASKPWGSTSRSIVLSLQELATFSASWWNHITLRQPQLNVPESAFDEKSSSHWDNTRIAHFLNKKFQNSASSEILESTSLEIVHLLKLVVIGTKFRKSDK